MLHYHKIMQYVWLAMSALVLIASTYMGFQDGFDKWWMMYLFLAATILQYFRHKFQLKKMGSQEEKKSSK
jgi:hypothetical protein